MEILGSALNNAEENLNRFKMANARNTDSHTYDHYVEYYSRIMKDIQKWIECIEKARI